MSGMSLGKPILVLPVSMGGTGASSEPAARGSLGVPSLSEGNAFAGTQTFNGPVTVADEALTVTQTNGVVTKGVVFRKDPHIVTIGDPDWMSLTSDQHMIPPDASGTIVVTPDSPAHGSVLWFNGSAWKALAPGSAGQTLHIDGSGDLYWA